MVFHEQVFEERYGASPLIRAQCMEVYVYIDSMYKPSFKQRSRKRELLLQFALEHGRVCRQL